MIRRFALAFSLAFSLGIACASASWATAVAQNLSWDIRKFSSNQVDWEERKLIITASATCADDYYRLSRLQINHPGTWNAASRSLGGTAVYDSGAQTGPTPGMGVSYLVGQAIVISPVDGTYTFAWGAFSYGSVLAVGRTITYSVHWGMSPSDVVVTFLPTPEGYVPEGGGGSAYSGRSASQQDAADSANRSWFEQLFTASEEARDDYADALSTLRNCGPIAAYSTMVAVYQGEETPWGSGDTFHSIIWQLWPPGGPSNVTVRFPGFMHPDADFHGTQVNNQGTQPPSPFWAQSYTMSGFAHAFRTILAGVLWCFYCRAIIMWVYRAMFPVALGGSAAGGDSAW